MFGCIYCGQTFAQKSKLTYHIRKHTGENLETCPICSKLFTSPCSLREHLKTHEAIPRNIPCPLCDRKFCKEKQMLIHMRGIHTEAKKTLKCPLCKKMFASPAARRLHVQTHAKIDMFQCNCCPKSYNNNKTLMRHLRMRHDILGDEVNIKDYIKRLDPRNCKLGLDEETIVEIFGPQKQVMQDVLLGDFITFPNRLNTRGAVDDNGKGEHSAAKDSNANSSESDNEDDDNEEEQENDEKMNEECEQELEPTDFVSVKVEPIDEDEVFDC